MRRRGEWKSGGGGRGEGGREGGDRNYRERGGVGGGGWRGQEKEDEDKVMFLSVKGVLCKYLSSYASLHVFLSLRVIGLYAQLFLLCAAVWP